LPDKRSCYFSINIEIFWLSLIKCTGSGSQIILERKCQ
jgi:hypothetical protein